MLEMNFHGTSDVGVVESFEEDQNKFRPKRRELEPIKHISGLRRDIAYLVE